jgi:5'-3' exonuclease
VGDSADGFPGLSGWGARSAAAVLDAYGSLDAIPDDPGSWTVSVRGAARLASVLKADRALAERFRTLARLRRDVDVLPTGVDALRWSGPTDRITAVAETLGASELPERLIRLANARAG